MTSHYNHGEALQRFADFSPTALDRRGPGSEGQEDWRVMPVGQNRDSDVLERSNFRVLVRQMEDQNIPHEIHRFGHWACGWFEIIIVPPTQEALTFAGDIVAALATYPILDEDDCCELEYEEYEQDEDL